jgi:flagellar assembly factor FliW
MKYTTRDFGEMEIKESSILHFAQPPFGFEKYKTFALIYDKTIGSSIVWMQSLEEPALCFLLMDPTPLASCFTPKLPQEAQKLLGKAPDDTYECWVMMSIPGHAQDTTLNLKSPIFINPETNCAAQVMLEQEYPVRFPLPRKKGAQ